MHNLHTVTVTNYRLALGPLTPRSVRRCLVVLDCRSSCSALSDSRGFRLSAMIAPAEHPQVHGRGGDLGGCRCQIVLERRAGNRTAARFSRITPN